MKISIIVPLYKEENSIMNFLSQFIDYKDKKSFEILLSVLPSGKEDTTITKIKEFEKKYTDITINIITLDKRGRALPLIKGAQKACGEVLLFLHADAELGYSSFKSLKKTLKNDNSIIGGAFSIMYNNNEILYKYIAFYSNLRARIFSMYHGDQGMFIRKKAYNAISGIPEVPLMEDVILSERMRLHGKTILLPYKIIASDRRIKKNGFFRMLFTYFYLKTLYAFNYDLHYIAKVYNAMK